MKLRWNPIVSAIALVVLATLSTSCIFGQQIGDEGAGIPGPSQVRELVREIIGVYALSISPDASKMVYVSFLDPAEDKVYVSVRDAHKGSAMQLLENSSITSAIWGPDNSSIAYLTYANNKQSESIGLLNDEAMEPENIVDLMSYDIVSTPAWSPDGRFIAFWSRKYVDEQTTESTLWLMRPDGSDLKTIYGGPGAKPAGILTGDLAWSPDNSKLLVTMKNGDATTAYTVERRDSSLKSLTSNHLKASDLFWSPTGQRIGYAAVEKNDPNGPAKVWVMNADGSHKEALGPIGRPVGWIPNSGELVYIAGDKGDPWPASRLEAVDIKTKAIRQLAQAEDANIVAATVSRDSRVFYATANADGEGKIFVVE